MTRTGDVEATGDSPQAQGADYTGAIYGSLLAASVVVGSAVGAPDESDVRPLRLAASLIVTGLVFWVAHAYARLVGDRAQHTVIDAREIRRIIRREWPLLGAALPPAAAALLFGLLGASNRAAAWAALLAAIVGQVGWATTTTIRAGASTPLVVMSAAVNLLLGLVIVLLKSALNH
jgi:hypothetical protein